jgi:hypothetical protein
MQIAKTFLVALSVLLLGACSGLTINQTYTSSGVTAYQITCGGIFGGADTSSCYLAAGNICGTKGYSTAYTGPSSIIASCREGENNNATTSPPPESRTSFTSK